MVDFTTWGPSSSPGPFAYTAPARGLSEEQPQETSIILAQGGKRNRVGSDGAGAGLLAAPPVPSGDGEPWRAGLRNLHPWKGEPAD